MINIKNRRGKVRVALAVGLATLAAGMTCAVWSYSSATAASGALLKVVRSENALIAVETREINHPSESECGTVTNNMSQPLTDLQVSGTGNFRIKEKNLNSGESAPILIRDRRSGTYNGVVEVWWDGGRAEIEFATRVDIDRGPGNGNPGNGPGNGNPGNGNSVNGTGPGDAASAEAILEKRLEKKK